jgi:hypothetical protein
MYIDVGDLVKIDATGAIGVVVKVDWSAGDREPWYITVHEASTNYVGTIKPAYVALLAKRV